MSTIALFVQQQPAMFGLALDALPLRDIMSPPSAAAFFHSLHFPIKSH